MINVKRIERKNSGVGLSGYTVAAYAYSSGSTSGYTGVALYTFTDNGDGNYYADVSESVKVTIVVTSPTSEVVVPTHLIGIKLIGDNELNIGPSA